jgi:nucleoside diphosphate kinase
MPEQTFLMIKPDGVKRRLVVHTSDSIANAKKEINNFFEKAEIIRK